MGQNPVLVSLLSSHRKTCPDAVLCYDYTAAGTWKTNFWLFGVSLHYRHCRVNMITWFGALCLSSFLLQIQLNNMCLNRATLLVCGIFNEKKRGNLQLIHSLQSSKDGIWQHEGWFLSRHSYPLLKAAHSFSPFQLSSFRIHGFRAGPESFTAMLPIFIPSACWWINTNLELRWTQTHSFTSRQWPL